MIALRAGAALFVALVASSCARLPGAESPPLFRVVLAGTDGAAHSLAEEVRSARLTVLVFTSWTCPCQAAHDARLREIDARYRPLGVRVLAIDPGPSGSLARDADQAARRGYRFPVLLDAGGALARAMGAEYATEAFVLDSSGAVRYHGGLDSDRNEIHADARPYLRDALDDVLAGKRVRVAESEPLGCALETW